MSNITITKSNLSLFKKRLQKSLKNYLGLEIKLHEAGKIFASAIGVDSEYELQKVLSPDNANPLKESSLNKITVYIAMDKKWVEAQTQSSSIITSSKNLAILAMYSEKTYQNLTEQDKIINSVIVQAQVDIEDLVDCTNASIFGDKNTFDICITNLHLESTPAKKMKIY